MTRAEALAIAAPLFAAAAAGLFALLTNYFDDRAAAKRLTQKQADASRQITDPAGSVSDLADVEPERLKLHIESLEAFAKAVRNASAAVEESSRRVRATADAHRTAGSEQHQPS
jgi:methyl-accepting chemotaxis protein